MKVKGDTESLAEVLSCESAVARICVVVGFSPVALSFLEKEKENCSTNQVPYFAR